MYLKALEIQGFKSFPDKTRIAFEKDVTAIVGPNGSGKSNIADAILWVLGEQSSKTLRGGKMEDVIFSGTENRKPLGFAEVSMVLDNGDKALPLEFSEVAVTRRVYRSGESEYSINGAACRLKDIHELFMDTGVGKEGYSIIGQGKIEEILSVKSEDRRLLFEEAAGISKYRSRRDEALAKLDRERQNLTRVDDIVAELESQIGPLLESSEKAKEYLSLRDELKVVQVNSFLNQVDDAGKKLAGMKSSLQIVVNQIADEEQKLAERQSEYASLREQSARASAFARELSESREGLLRAADGQNGEISLARERIKNLQTENERLEQAIDKRKASIERKKAENLSEEERFARTEALLLENREALAEKQAALDETDAALRDKEKEIESLNAGLVEKAAEAAETRAEIHRLELAYEELERAKERLNEEAAGRESRFAELEAAKDAAEEAAEEAKSRIMDAQKVLSFQSAERENLSKQLGEKYAERSALEKTLHAAESRLKALKDLERDMEGYYRSVKYILREKQRNPRLSGICGAVGELAEAPEEYALAIEIALGASVQDIIAETEEVASAAIELLKASKEGRATFLPLTAVKPRDLGGKRQALLSEKGVIGVAKDVITYDPKYENAFANLLGGVLITDSLDTAVRISRKYGYNYKLVTVAGEVINPGGSMTGGSVANRGSGIFNRGREIEKLTKSVAADSAEDKRISGGIDALNAKKQATDEEIDKTRKKIQDLMLQHNNSKNTLENAQAEIARQQAARAELAAEDADVMARIIEKNRETREARETLSKADSVILTLKNGLESRQSAISDSRQAREAVSNELTELKISISSLEAALNLSMDGMGRAGDEITVLERENAADEEAIEANRVREAGQDEAIRAAENEIALLELQIEDCLAKNRQNDETLQTLAEALESLDGDKTAGSEALSRLSAEKARLEMRAEQTEEDVRRLYDTMWDEYKVTYQSALEVKRLEMGQERLSREERRLKNALRDLGDVNVGAIEEYKTIKQRFDFLNLQRSDIIQAEDKLKGIIAELTELMETRFSEQFGIISRNFGEVFTEMFGGGRAYLKLTDENDVLESGIEIVAQPPGKTLRNMLLLSGGERALTAIALLFGILRMKPSPFCILDEIEAALDDANVARFAEFIKNYAGGTQFIIITHRKGTMEAADVLYGVTMQEQGISKLVSVKLEEAS